MFRNSGLSLPLGFLVLTAACGNQFNPSKTVFAPGSGGSSGDSTEDTSNITLVSSYPEAGTTIQQLSQAVLTFSHELAGLDVPENYKLSGAGMGTLALSATNPLSKKRVALKFDGTPANGPVALTISNLTTLKGTAVNNFTVTWQGSAQAIQVNKNLDFVGPGVSQFQLTFDQEVTGADDIANYTFSGTGAGGIYITSITKSGTTYTINVDSSSVGDGQIDLTLSGVTDSQGQEQGPFVFTFYGDTVMPTVSSVDVQEGDGTYGVGNTLTVAVQFTESIRLDTSGGSPYLQLETGTTDETATHSGDNGGDTLFFTYTVQAGNLATPLDYFDTAALVLNGSVLTDAALNSANTTLATVGATGSISFDQAINIDGVVPMITGVSGLEGAGTYTKNDVLTIRVQFGEPVTVTGTPEISLNNGGLATFANDAGAGLLEFTYTVQAGEDTAGLEYGSTTALSLAGGTITDSGGNNAILDLPTIGGGSSLSDSVAWVIDTTIPAIQTVSGTNGLYAGGQTITLTITFDGPVDANSGGGTPDLSLANGGTAVYSGGVQNGVTSLTFDYIVGPGEDTGLLDYSGVGALALNGGSIAKAGTGTPAGLSLPAPGSTGSLADQNTISVDTTAPGQPAAPVLATTDDTGISDSDAITKSTTGLTFSGSAEPNSTVEIFFDAATMGTTTADGAGDYSIDIDSGAGVYGVTVTATDAAGNTSSASPALSLEIDTTAPAGPAAPDLDNLDDSGSSPTDNLTKETTGLTLTGTVEANAQVKVYVDGGGSPVATFSADGGGSYSGDIDLTEGIHSVTVKANDAAGNVSNTSAALSLTVDTTPPADPAAPDFDALDDSGDSDSDNITKNTTGLTFTGSGEIGALYELHIDGGLNSAAALDGAGNFSEDLTLAEGSHDITYYIYDQAGNYSAESPATTTIEVDTTAPAIPSQPVLDSGDDTGPDDTDGITQTISNFTYTGTADPNTKVEIWVDAAVDGNVTSDGTGNYSYEIPGPFADGFFGTITAVAVDVAGNASAASAGSTLSVDTTATAEVTSLVAAMGDGQLSLSWANPADGDFAGTRIVRKTGSFPTNPTDGSQVYNGTGTSFTDTGLTNGTTYYYKAFAEDWAGNLTTASGAGSQATGTPEAPVNASISSAANQTFVVGDAATTISDITINAGNQGDITAANDIRIRIPAAFNMIWDASVTSFTAAGSASGKVNAALVSYEDAGKTMVIDVTTDFANGEDLVISGPVFDSFSSPSAADNLELETDNLGTVLASDDKTISVLNPISISSAANQSFGVGDPVTTAATITITDTPGGSVTAVGDIRVRIPAAFNMTWDTSLTSFTAGGTASGKVDNALVAYEDGNRTLVIDVTTNFSAGEDLTISGLSFQSFSGISAADNLELELDNAGTVATTDDKTIEVGAGATISSFTNQSFGAGDPGTEAAVITITEGTGSAIRAASDIRIRVPAGFNMEWDNAVSTVTLGGAAAGKADMNLSYEDSNQTVVVTVTSDFAPGEALTVSGLAFAGFSAASPADNLELELDNAGSVHSTDDKTITVGAGSSISSAANQYLYVGDPATTTATITLTEGAGSSIRAAEDIRIRIPGSLDMAFDNTVTSITVGGTAAASVNATGVTYEDSDKTVVLDVTTDFAPGDILTIDGLQFTTFGSVSGPGLLQLEIDNAGSLHANDDKVIQVLDKTFYTTASGDPANATIWSPSGCGGGTLGVLPPSDAELVICGGHVVTLAGNMTAAAVTINNTGELQGASYVLNIATFWDNQPGGTFTPGGSTVVFGGNGDAAADTFTILFNGNSFNSLQFNDPTGLDTWELSDNGSVSGNFEMAAGTLNLNSRELTIAGGFNQTGGSIPYSAGSSIRFNATAGPQPISQSAGSMLNTVYFDGAGSWQLNTAFDPGRDVHLAAGTLDLNGFELSTGGNLFEQTGGTLNANGGYLNVGSYASFTGGTANLGTSALYSISSNLSISGSASIDFGGSQIAMSGDLSVGTTGTLTPGTAVITNNNATGGTLNTNAELIPTLTLEGGGTFTNNSVLNVQGSLNISNGTLATASNDIQLTGNWTLGGAGAFTASPGQTVSLMALSGTQSVAGDNSFENLSIVNGSGARTVSFAAGAEQVVNGVFSVTGSIGQEISLVSATPGTQTTITVNGSLGTIEYVNVSDHVLGGGAVTTALNPPNSVNNGNNLGWFGEMVARWELNGTGMDSTGYANDFVIGGASSAPDRHALNGNAGGFDGATQFYSTNVDANSQEILTHTDFLSYSAWFKGDDFSGEGFIFYNGNSSPNGYGARVVSSGELTLFFGGIGDVATGQILNTNQWYHVVVTRQGGTWKVYLDGKDIGAFAGNTTNPNAICSGACGATSVGANFDGSASYFEGAIDDARVFNYPLSATEVLNVYNTWKWDGGGDAISWNDAANWTGDTLPAAGADVILDNAYEGSGYTVQLPTGGASIGNLEVSGGTPPTLDLQGQVLNINHHLRQKAGTIQNGSLHMLGFNDGPFEIVTNGPNSTLLTLAAGGKTFGPAGYNISVSSLSAHAGILDTEDLLSPGTYRGITLAGDFNIGDGAGDPISVVLNSSTVEIGGGMGLNTVDGSIDAGTSTVIHTGNGTFSGIDQANKLNHFEAAFSGNQTTVSGNLYLAGELRLEDGTLQGDGGGDDIVILHDYSGSPGTPRTVFNGSPTLPASIQFYHEYLDLDNQTLTGGDYGDALLRVTAADKSVILDGDLTTTGDLQVFGYSGVQNAGLSTNDFQLDIGGELMLGDNGSLTGSLTETGAGGRIHQLGSVSINTGSVFTAVDDEYRISGDWDNLNAFNAGVSVFVFENTTNGAIQNISGSSGFDTLLFPNTGQPRSIYVKASTTLTVGSMFEAYGDSGAWLTLDTISGSGQFTIDGAGTAAADWVDVSNSNLAVTGTALPLNPSNFNSTSGNTIGWDSSASPPAITSFVADDPDDGDSVFSNGDTIRIVFDINTNQPSIGSKAQVDTVFNFSQSLGTDYTGSWVDAQTAEISIIDATGSTPPGVGALTVTVQAGGNLKNQAGTSVASTAISGMLTGDWGAGGPNSGPTISAAEYYDTDANGVLDHVKITFSEPVQDSTFDGWNSGLGDPDNGIHNEAMNWEIAGRWNVKLDTRDIINNVNPADDGINDNVLWLQFDESGFYDTGDTPDLWVNNSTLQDVDGSPCYLNTTSGTCGDINAADVTTIDVVESDKAGPQLISVMKNLAVANELILTFSEPADSISGGGCDSGSGSWIVDADLSYSEASGGDNMGLAASGTWPDANACDDNMIIVQGTGNIGAGDIATDGIGVVGGQVFDAFDNEPGSAVTIIRQPPVNHQAYYPTSGNGWNQYVQNDDPQKDILLASDTACDTSLAGTAEDVCIHGGQMRYVEVPGFTSCHSGLAAETQRSDDSVVGAFEWKCSSYTAPIRLVAVGFKEGKGLKDLIAWPSCNGTTCNWLPLKVSVTLNGNILFKTTDSPWAVNTIRNERATFSTVGNGEVYALDQSFTNTGPIQLMHDQVAVVAQSAGVVITGTAFPSAILEAVAGTVATPQKGIWIEGGSYVGVGESVGLKLGDFAGNNSVRLARIQDVGVSGGGSALDVAGIAVERSEKIVIEDSGVAEVTGEGLLLNDSQENTLRNFVTENTGMNGIGIHAGSDGNSLENISVKKAGGSQAEGTFISDSDCYGLKINQAKSNIIKNLAVSYTKCSGLALGSSKWNYVENARLAVTISTLPEFAAGLALETSIENTFANLKISNSAGDGISLYNSSRNALFNVLSVSNNNSGIFITGDNATNPSNDNILWNFTLASNGGPGLDMDGSPGGDVVSSLISNGAIVNYMEGLIPLEISNTTFMDLAIAHGDGIGIFLDTTVDDYFTGELKIGNNGVSDCDTLGGSPGLDNSCNNQGASDKVLTGSVSLVNEFVGPIGVDDSANTSDTNGYFAHGGDGSLYDWVGFDNDFRAYGVDSGSGYPDRTFAFDCDGTVNADCRILDHSLSGSATQLHRAHPVPTGNDTHRQTWSATTSGDCALIEGASWGPACSIQGYPDSGSCTGAGGDWATSKCSSLILRHAVEYIGDSVGNENGLCEGGENCVFTPHIGAYQGHMANPTDAQCSGTWGADYAGKVEQLGELALCELKFTSGTLTNIRLFGWDTLYR